LLRAAKVVAALAFVALSFTIFASSMAKPVEDGEHAVCTAGVLLAKGQMVYRDFAHVAQMPYHALLCAAVFKVLSTTHYLLVARSLTVLCDIFILVCVVGIYRRVFASMPVMGWLLGTAMAVLCVFSPLVDRFSGLASSRDFAVLCLLLSFWLFISRDSKQKVKLLRSGVIGALLTLATCVWLPAFFVELLFFAMLVIQPAESVRQRLEAAAAFLMGAAVVLLLPAWIMIQAPRAFLVDVFGMATLRRQLTRKVLVLMGGPLYGRLEKVLVLLTLPAGILPAVIAICIAVMIVWHRRKLDVSNLRYAVFALLLPLTLFVVSLCGPSLRTDNLAMLMPFVLVSFAYPLLYLRIRAAMDKPHQHLGIAAAVVVACAISAIGSQRDLLLRIPDVFRPRTWFPMKLHRIAGDIGQNTPEPKLIVTLSPLYALEGGCHVYAELCPGRSGCELANVMSGDSRDITRTLNVETFKRMLEETPPSGIIIDQVSRSGMGLALIHIAKTGWPDEQYYDKTLWERKEYRFSREYTLDKTFPSPIVAYFRQ
jgi:hypothetical protein